MTFSDIDEIRQANRRIGQHWFDADSLHFFDSRIHNRPLIHGQYFISSEQYHVPPCGPSGVHGDNRDTRRGCAARLYTIRIAHPNGQVETVNEFQGYSTYKDAEIEATKLG